MDKNLKEFQFLGLYGIYREAYVITLSWKILSQITMPLILPLSFIYLGQIQASYFPFIKVLKLDANSPMDNELILDVSHNRFDFRLSEAVYLLLILIVSLQSISAIVYAVACIYTAQEVTFKRVISVIPKVRKRVLVTFLWYFIIILGYNIIALPIVVSITLIIKEGPSLVPVVASLSILYFIGFVCINIVWHLASVVSVLENMYGIQAMIKSMKLIRGKMWVTSRVFLMIHVPLFMIQIAFQKLVIHGESLGAINRVCYGLLLVVLFSMLIHLGIVTQTIIYFVCKSYHDEDIGKLCLADHLEVYGGECSTAKGKRRSPIANLCLRLFLLSSLWTLYVLELFSIKGEDLVRIGYGKL